MTDPGRCGVISGPGRRPPRGAAFQFPLLVAIVGLSACGTPSPPLSGELVDLSGANSAIVAQSDLLTDLTAVLDQPGSASLSVSPELLGTLQSDASPLVSGNNPPIQLVGTDAYLVAENLAPRAIELQRQVAEAEAFLQLKAAEIRAQQIALKLTRRIGGPSEYS